MDQLITGFGKDTLYQLGVGGVIAIVILGLVFAFIIKIMQMKKDTNGGPSYVNQKDFDSIKKWLASIDKKVDDIEIKIASNYTRQEVDVKLNDLHKKIENRGGWHGYFF